MTSVNNEVSAYNLANVGSNIWTHLAMVIDKSTSNIVIYQDGALVDTISDVSLEIPTDDATATNICIGYDTDNTEYFEGNMDDFRLYNRAMNSNDITNIFNTKLSDKMLFNYDFEHYNVERGEIYDQSINMNTGTMHNMSSNIFDMEDKAISSTSFNTSDAVTEYFKIAGNNTMVGSNLNKCTFSAWVKTSELNSFEPIVSRDGVFSFGLNFGHACLRLGDGNSFSQLTSVQASSGSEQQASSPSAPVVDLTTNLMKDVTFEKDTTGVTHHNNPEEKLNDAYDGSTGLCLQEASNQYVEIDGSDYGSTDLSSFSFSGWVKFNNIPSVGELPIFNRGDGELKFGLSNGALVLGMMVNMMGNIELDLENYDQTSGTIPNKGTFQISEFTVSGTTKPSLEYDTDGTYIHLTRSNYIDLLSALPIINVTPNRTDITIFYTFKIVSINSVENFQFAIFGTDSRMYILITPDNINVAKIIIGSGTQVINGLPISVGDLYKVVISHNASTDMNKIYWYNATTDTMTERDITFGISQFDQSRFAINSGSSDVLDRPCDQKLYTFKMFNKYIDELQSVYTDFFT